MESAPLLLDHLTAEDAEHFAEVRARLDAAGVEYVIDPTLVRGLDYYTRTLFEFTSDALGAQSGVGGGGRYDGLVEALGGSTPTPGIGWAAGVERMLLAGDHKPHPEAVCDLYVAGHERRPRSPWPPRRAAPGSTCSSSSPGARARASSSRPTDPARATSPSSAKTKGPS